MKEYHDYVILGGGPAGIQLGYFFEKAERDYVVLERGNHAGSFFDVFPRHRQLISINKLYTGSNDSEFNLRHDWNSLLSEDLGLLFRDYDERFFPNADNFVRYVNDFVNKYGVKLTTDVRVTRVTRAGDGFSLFDAAGREYSCRCLIVATGLSRSVIPDIPGIELAECYSKVTLDREEFKNKRVLILGKGNSAFETADHLVESAALLHLASPESIDMAWKTHYVGHLRAVNNTILDTYQLKSQNAVLDAEVRGIRRDGALLKVSFEYAHAEGEIEEIGYHRVIYCTGFRFDGGMFDASAAPELTPSCKYPAITWDYASVNQPGMYFAGTITHSLDYRKATSGFVHGFRYNSRALARILAENRHGEPWPAERLEADPNALALAALGRANRSSALWQQSGYMMDVFGVESGGVVHLMEMPKGFARQFGDDRFDSYFTTSLEYGAPIVGDPFNVERVHRLNVEDSSRSQFLHPVVRHYAKGKCVAEHHVLEDLEAIWVEPEHVDPLTIFFDKALNGEFAAKEISDEEMA